MSQAPPHDDFADFLRRLVFDRLPADQGVASERPDRTGGPARHVSPTLAANYMLNLGHVRDRPAPQRLLDPGSRRVAQFTPEQILDVERLAYFLDEVGPNRVVIDIKGGIPAASVAEAVAGAVATYRTRALLIRVDEVDVTQLNPSWQRAIERLAPDGVMFTNLDDLPGNAAKRQALTEVFAVISETSRHARWPIDVSFEATANATEKESSRALDVFASLAARHGLEPQVLGQPLSPSGRGTSIAD